ncbi:MAG TPA: hypothetical protein VF715_02100 [Thermoleophilaceae bacterium]
MVGGAVAYNAGESKGDTPVYALGIAAGVLGLLGAWALLRRVHPPRLYGVSLEVEPERAEPGQELAVRVELKRAGAGEGVRVGLVGTSVKPVSYVDHRGVQQTIERTEVLHEHWRDLPADGPVPDLRFVVPAYARPTGGKGSRGRVSWAVVAHRPARWRFDRRLRRAVEVTR